MNEEPQYPPSTPTPNASPSVTPVSPSLAQTGPVLDPMMIGLVSVLAIVIGLALWWIGRVNRAR